MPSMGRDKHKAKLRNLYIRVREEGNRYIADFFKEDDTFVEDWVVSKDRTTLEEFLKGCETCAYFLDTGKW